MLYLFIFFFQAEDGIRDLTVTGVQTCALPISCHARDFQREHDADVAERNFRSHARKSRALGESGAGYTQVFVDDGHLLLRSEERRVGKECRSRWSPYH